MLSSNKPKDTSFPEEEMSLVPGKYSSSFITLSDERMIFLAEDFTKHTSSEMTALLLHYNQESKTAPITIYIHSQGGDAAAMMNIIDIIDLIEAPVHTVCLGRAYSAGAFLLMSGSHRMIAAHGEIMLHSAQVLYPIPGKEGAIDSQDYGKFIHDFDDRVMRILAKASKKSLKEVKKDCESDLFLSAKEALAYGIIDQILGG
jgi:ATP-dependent Clp protease protease subunit